MKQQTIDFENAERRQILGLWRPDEIFEEADQSLLSKKEEDFRLERKSAGISPDLLATYISMWANTQPEGGVIVIGIDDDGKFTGCKHKEKELTDNEHRIRNDLVPEATSVQTKRVQITNTKGEPDFVVLWYVGYVSDKVVTTNKGEAFIRYGSSRHQLNADEMQQLRIDRGQKVFELEPCGLIWPNDFNMDAVRNWMRLTLQGTDHSAEAKTEDVLTRHFLGKSVRGKFIPNVACSLLFANNPQEVVAGCMVVFQRVEGSVLKIGGERNVSESIDITGTIPNIIDKTRQIVSTRLRSFRKYGRDGKFFVESEYPEEAWQEVVTNACAHRSYNLKGANIFIRMFDDKFVVDSPGGFAGLVTTKNIYETCYRRNWWLTAALKTLGYVLCENEGVKRIRSAMKAQNLPDPIFEQRTSNQALVKVTLKNDKDARSSWVDSDIASLITLKITQQLDEIDRRFINFAAENGRRIKVVQAQNLLPKPRWHTANKRLDRLVEMKLFQKVSRFQRDPNTYFELTGRIKKK